MRIQHNIAALNSFRNLTNNNSAVSKNLEKLSSGYRINRAGDDAAGLAISEKMRAQITGLETAQKNASDGISLVQTAEGALTEVHSMLNRMVELADQSANGTYKNEVDRENLEAELNSLKDEIDRISKATNFNGINLLDGSLGGAGKAPVVTFNGTAATDGGAFEAVAGEYQATIAAGSNGQKATLTISYKLGDETKTVNVEYVSGNDANESAKAALAALQENKELSDLFDITSGGTDKINFVAKEAGTAGAIITNGASILNDKAAVDGGHLFNDDLAAGDSITVDGKTYTVAATGGTTDEKNGIYATSAELLAALQKDGYKLVNHKTGKDAAAFAADTVLVRDNTKSGLTLQIGDTADDFNQLKVSVKAMDTASLGIKDISIADQTSAKAAVETLKDAINKVSSTRGDLGAIQNRLEHTINNLSVTSENMTAAESRIRDVDMAKEMMAYTKNNILVQSSQAMLAQANQVPQGVLQLLQ